MFSSKHEYAREIALRARLAMDDAPMPIIVAANGASRICATPRRPSGRWHSRYRTRVGSPERWPYVRNRWCGDKGEIADPTMVGGRSLESAGDQRMFGPSWPTSMAAHEASRRRCIPPRPNASELSRGCAFGSVSALSLGWTTKQPLGGIGVKGLVKS